MSDTTARYPATVFWSDEDEGFIATAADLPGCSAFGDTQQEALTELQDAIVAWIEAARSAVAIPCPCRRIRRRKPTMTASPAPGGSVIAWTSQSTIRDGPCCVFLPAFRFAPCGL